MPCSCGHCDLDIEGLKKSAEAAVAGGHVTAETAAANIRAVTGAREMARDIISQLEPRHISGWASLITILETVLANARAEDRKTE
jgi:hypothetical protein